MNITVVGGGGYVGITTSACLAFLGHRVYCTDTDQDKISLINKGITSIYEQKLDEILRQVIGTRLLATTDVEGSISDSSIVFICVGTPSNKDGSIDLRQLAGASEVIGKVLAEKKNYTVIVIKSTIVPGTTEETVIPLVEKSSRKIAGYDFGVCVNPEFLREGSAVNDFLCPKDQGIVIGELDNNSGNSLFHLYRDFNASILRTTIRAAEMIKYARNAYLAKDISFANEIANICGKLGIDYLDVKKGLEMDSRIGVGRFLNAGIGFGGSCFPKDVRALVAKAKGVGVCAKMLQATLDVNENQPLLAVDMLRKALGSPRGKTIAVLGLAFKPGTDDIREAKSIPIIEGLLAEEARMLLRLIHKPMKRQERSSGIGFTL